MRLINFVLHKPNVQWTITGANSLVKVTERIVCLAFVERNQTFGQAIVIGGYQMQDNLLEFDLPAGGLRKASKSSTYKPGRCGSTPCNLARSTGCGNCLTENNTRPGCNNNACYNVVSNPVTSAEGEIAEDVLSIQSINGSIPGPCCNCAK
ncbi:hypothetical protein HAX54_052047, partial [Datura stramonium]|nr:hypothetical protein [Datura stramonium]